MSVPLRRVLLLHPDADFRETASLCLQAGEWECKTCRTPGEAVSAVPGFAPDVLVLGVPWEGLDGAAALAALRSSPAAWATPALIVASSSNEREVARLRAAGATRVLSSPLAPTSLPDVLREFLDEARRSAVDPWQAQLAALHRDFVAQLPAKVARIEADWLAWQNANAEERGSQGKGIHRQAHSLVGGGATFGFPEISSAARRLEAVLRPLRDGLPPDLSEAQQAANLASLGEAMQTALNDLRNTVAQSQGRISWILGARLPRLWRASQERLIWLVDLPGEDALALARFGFTVRVLSGAAARETSRDSATPSLSSYVAALPAAVIGALDSWTPDMALDAPVLLAGVESFENRRLAVRLGARGFCPLPLHAESIAAQLEQHAAVRPSHPLRVLLVCNEPAVIELYTLLLTQSGFLVRHVERAALVADTAREFDVDLFLIDATLSDCDAAELGAVLRGYEAFTTTPILFLDSASPERERARLWAVGDEILKAPVPPEVLVDAVGRRAARARVLRDLRTRDTLTGLLTPSLWQEQLKIEISRGLRQDSELSLGLLDVRNLQTINQDYGYAAGDLVLRALGRLVRGRLRQTDVIGREGGHLTILLHGAPLDAAYDVLDILCRDFASLRFVTALGEFTAQLACGCASLSEHTGSETSREPPTVEKRAVALRSTAGAALASVKNS